MTLDLFSDDVAVARPAAYREAIDDWLASRDRAGALTRASSREVYEQMWAPLMAWAVGHGIALDALASDDLERYLASRGGADELEPRYALRLMRLVDRVLEHRGRQLGRPANPAAKELLARRPDLRHANAGERELLPEMLEAAEAKRLVTFLSVLRPGRAAPGQPWQDVRNRCSVGLMLGAGITPGEVRTLQLGDVVIDGGRRQGVPWKLRVPGDGDRPARETPIAPWAGTLLQHWLAVRREQGIPGTMLFPSTKRSGKPWGKAAQHQSARLVLAAAGIDALEGGSFRLRHTFAIRQLRRGTSVAQLARWMGIVDLSTMNRYLRVVAAPADVV